MNPLNRQSQWALEESSDSSPERSFWPSSSPPSLSAAVCEPSRPAASSPPPPFFFSLRLAWVYGPESLVPAGQKRTAVIRHDWETRKMNIVTVMSIYWCYDSLWTQWVELSPVVPPSTSSPSLRSSAHPYHWHCETHETSVKVSINYIERGIHHAYLNQDSQPFKY